MNFNSKSFALKAFAIFLIFLSYQSNISAQKKPNIIYILGDDVGYDLLSINGSKSYSTPHIDSMAHHGMNFTHCEGNPLCSPSRCKLLTGKYNFRNYSNWGYLSDTAKTFGNVMHDAGYKTAFFGKLQLPFSNVRMDNWGFDKYTIFEVTEDSVQDYRYKTPTLFDNNGIVADTIVSGKYCDDILTDRILNFIDSNANNPFFIYYPTSVVHAPFSPTPTDSAYAGWPEHNGSKSDTSFFRSMVEHMDVEVGLILDKLVKKGLDKNTIVIFNGDNGTPTQISYNVDTFVNVEGQKSHTVEAGTHVPLIAYWPLHIKESQTNDDLIDFTDFLPTFAEVAGNKDLLKYGTLDGLSFYSRMLGIEDTAKQQLFFHYDAHPGFEGLKRWVRDKTYKLYQGLDGGPYLFYNFIADKKEKKPIPEKNLTSKEKNIKARFKAILDSMPTWSNEPVLDNKFVKNITSISATIGATILNSGSSSLIDRGSNLFVGTPYFCVLGFNRMRDSIVNTGTFAQNRTDLASQTLYSYSVYAMNANVSHSTGYAFGNFYTLSAPPLSQPSYFKACADNSSILLSWGHATFPTSGATLKGYAVFYSTDSIMLSANPNGSDVSKVTQNGTLLYFDTNRSANKLDTILRVSSLKKNTLYHFLLVPYTWNGTTDSTCNYLTAGALSATLNYTTPLTLSSTKENPFCFNSKDGNITAFASNGNLPYNFYLNDEGYSTDSVFNNLSSGSYLLTVRDANGCLDSESVILKSPSQIELSLSVKNTDCTPDGKIAVSAKNGIPPYMFSFDNGKFDTTSHFNNLSKGEYMIEVEDSNKCIVSSDAIIKATTQNCTTDANIFPNPSNSVFKLKISNQISNHIIIKVYDVLGKLVYSDHGKQNTSYAFGNTLMKGVYFVKVESDSDDYIFKIIKE